MIKNVTIWYDYCHDIQCPYLTDDERCSKGFDPDWCEEMAYKTAEAQAEDLKMQQFEDDRWDKLREFFS